MCMETNTKQFTVRRYAPEQDYPLVNGWWQARHGALEDLPPAMLPPLGVVIEDLSGPLFALWCYEAAGVGVGTLEWPLSRPGTPVAVTRAAFRRAVEAVVLAAGQCWVPPGEYRVFRANVSPAMLRAIGGMGFRREYQEERIPVILSLGERERERDGAEGNLDLH